MGTWTLQNEAREILESSRDATTQRLAKIVLELACQLEEVEKIATEALTKAKQAKRA